MIGSLVAPAAMVLLLGAVRIGLVRPLHGLLLFLLLWVAGGAVSALLAYRALRAEQGGWAAHAAVAALLLGTFLIVAVRSRGAAAIHDVTTAPADPPEYVQAPALAGNRGRDLTYPHGAPDTPQIQRRAYPDLEPLHLPLAPTEAHERALAVAREMGWEITWSNRRQGRFEAVAVSPLFRFVDDVAVRVRAAAGGGCIVDVRSTSRQGRSDMGANAARIRAFAARLRAGVQGG